MILKVNQGFVLESGLINFASLKTQVGHTHNQLINSATAKIRLGIRGYVWPGPPYITENI